MSAYVNASLFSTDGQSPLDSQSKFRMLTLFSGGHAGAPQMGEPQMCTNIMFAYWVL